MLDKNNIVNIDLSINEIEIVVNALAQQPYIQVAKLIEKFQSLVLKQYPVEGESAIESD